MLFLASRRRLERLFEDLGGAGEDPRLRQLLTAERAAATAYLACLDALTALWDSTPAADRTGRRPHVLAEAGVALGLHPISVEARLAVAFTLQTHPQLRTLLATGRLGVAHVLTAAQESGALGDDDLATRVLAHVLDNGGPDHTPGWDDTPARLRRALARAAIRIDPAGAARRRTAQLTDRTGVRLRPQNDGLAAWIATGPAPQLLAADRLLHAAAAHPDGPDDPRSTGQRQLDTLLSALTARANSASGADGVRGVELELQIEIPVTVTTTRPVRGCTPEPATIRTDLTPDLLDLLTTPHHATNHAPSRAPSGTPACPTAGQPDPDPDADPVEPPPDPDDLPPDLQHDDPPEDLHDDPHDDPHGRADRAERADRREHRREAPRTDADTQQDQHALGRRTAPAVPRLGVPELLGAGPLDPAALAELLTDPAGLPIGLSTLTLRRICLDPHGQAVAVDPHAIPLTQLFIPPRTRQRRGAHRTDNPAPPAAPPGAPPGAPPAARLLSRLLQHLPTPPPTTPGYRPTAEQTRVVQACDHTCTFPGCSRTSRHTDLDHGLPHPQGPTSTSNLHPLCRHHHRLKHTGWTCTRHPDGTTTWTSPRGRPHRSTPG